MYAIAGAWPAHVTATSDGGIGPGLRFIHTSWKNLFDTREEFLVEHATVAHGLRHLFDVASDERLEIQRCVLMDRPHRFEIMLRSTDQLRQNQVMALWNADCQFRQTIDASMVVTPVDATTRAIDQLVDRGCRDFQTSVNLVHS